MTQRRTAAKPRTDRAEGQGKARQGKAARRTGHTSGKGSRSEEGGRAKGCALNPRLSVRRRLPSRCPALPPVRRSEGERKSRAERNGTAERPRHDKADKGKTRELGRKGTVGADCRCSMLFQLLFLLSSAPLHSLSPYPLRRVVSQRRSVDLSAWRPLEQESIHHEQRPLCHPGSRTHGRNDANS
jgi:hypothetical protein